MCVAGQNATDKELEEMNKMCKSYKAGNTITSLMNKGMHESKSDWNVFVMEGSFVEMRSIKKLQNFIKSEKDILFPIVIEQDLKNNRVLPHDNFLNCTLNGLTINRKTFGMIGNFSDNPLEISKLVWGLDAMHQGCKFKGVLGAQIL